jgi:hypothetical protein
MLVAFTTKKVEFLSFGKPFLDPLIYLIKLKIFAQNDKFTSMKGFEKNCLFKKIRIFSFKTSIFR